MSTLKSIFKTIVNVIGKPFYFFASLASIAGLVISIVSEQYAVNIALVTLCLCITTFTGYFVYLLHKLFNFAGEEVNVRSTFVKYETPDGKRINYECFKLIQSKRPILTHHEWGFKWSGTHLPKITSHFQEVENVVDQHDPNKYDKAILKLHKPLYFNQTSVVHFKANLDDTDMKSSTHVESKVKYEVDIIHYRIVLKHKSDDCSENAILERRKINSEVGQVYEEIRHIPFDTVTKSFEDHIISPEVGYYYRIRWSR